NLKVVPEKCREERGQDKKEKEVTIPSYKKHSTLLHTLLFIAFGFNTLLVNGDDNILIPLPFITSMNVGGDSMRKTGLQNVERFEFDMRTLMTVAVVGGVIIGEWAEVAIVVILFAISEALERFSMDRARRSISSLMDIAPKEALVRRNGQEMTVHVNDIAVGDIMIVKP